MIAQSSKAKIEREGIEGSPKFILITGEYPPQSGGVSDYSRHVAEGLARRGIEVVVLVFSNQKARESNHVCVKNVGLPLNLFSFWKASKILQSVGNNSIIFLQYVPQLYGLKGMNLAFVWWISAWKRLPLWIMFHEVYVSFDSKAPWKHRLLAAITRTMASQLALRSQRCLVSTPAFAVLVKKLNPLARPEWAPVPSNVATVWKEKEVSQHRNLISNLVTGPLVGHFGNYTGAVGEFLRTFVMKAIRSHPDWGIVLIGKGSLEFVSNFESRHGQCGSICASGELSSEEAATWIRACDVMVQPYPDGASSRRTSLMAGLALGKAVISNFGEHSELDPELCRVLYMVKQSDSASLIEGVEQVLDDNCMRARLEAASRALYQKEFALERTLARLITTSRKQAPMISNANDRSSFKPQQLGEDPMDINEKYEAQ